MNAVYYRKHSLIAAAIAASLAAAIGSASAESGNVSSGSTDVNKVFGRASTSVGSGSSIRTGGLGIAVLGRAGGQTGNPDASTRVTAGPAEGALIWAGRGSQPTYAVNANRGYPASVTAKVR